MELTKTLCLKVGKLFFLISFLIPSPVSFASEKTRFCFFLTVTVCSPNMGERHQSGLVVSVQKRVSERYRCVIRQHSGACLHPPCVSPSTLARFRTPDVGLRSFFF